VFILQLRNCDNEGILWFLECSPYFIIDFIILVVCAFSRTIRAVYAFFVVYEIFVICE
jgi:hypothetical protein